MIKELNYINMETTQPIEYKTKVRNEIKNISNKHIRFDELIVPENMSASSFQIEYEVVYQFKGNNGELLENKTSSVVSPKVSAYQKHGFIAAVEMQPVHVLHENHINDTKFFFTIHNGTNQEPIDVKVIYSVG